MKVTVCVKPVLTKEQFERLKKTVRKWNEACNYVSKWAWENKKFGQFKIQSVMYHKMRAEFPDIQSEAVLWIIKKVADAYKFGRNKLLKFPSYGGMTYGHKLIRWTPVGISIWSLGGRLKKIPFECSSRTREILKYQQGETEIGLVDNQFYITTTCNVELPIKEDFHI